MLTDDQLAKIERYAHPKTQDGKLIRRMCRELRTGTENYRRVCRERDQHAAIAADLVLAIGDLGYRVERDGGQVMLVPLDTSEGGDA